MAITLTATPEPTATPPRIRLNLAGAGGSQVSIYRDDPNGRRRPVRTAEPADLSGGSWVGYDYEAPYGQPVTYSGDLDNTIPASRTNYAMNPRGLGTTNYGGTWGWNGFASATVTQQTADFATGIKGFRRAFYPSADASSTAAGHYYTQALTAASGTSLSFGVKARSSITISARIVVTFYNGSATLNTITGTTTSVGSTITQLGVVGAPTSAMTSFMVQVQELSAVPAGCSFDVSALSILASSSAPTASTFFDGATSASATESYAWSGAPNASISWAYQSVIPTATTTLVVPDPWLIHPGIPANSVRVQDGVRLLRGSLAASKLTSSRTLVQASGRTTAIPISDAAGRRAPSSSLTVLTRSAADESALGNLLADDVPLLLNVPASLNWGISTQYISVGDVTENRIGVVLTDVERSWDLPFDVVDRPLGGYQAQWSVASVAATYATIADVVASYKTSADLVTNTPIRRAP